MLCPCVYNQPHTHLLTFLYICTPFCQKLLLSSSTRRRTHFWSYPYSDNQLQAHLYTSYICSSFLSHITATCPLPVHHTLKYLKPSCSTHTMSNLLLTFSQINTIFLLSFTKVQPSNLIPFRFDHLHTQNASHRDLLLNVSRTFPSRLIWSSLWSFPRVNQMMSFLE